MWAQDDRVYKRAATEAATDREFARRAYWREQFELWVFEDRNTLAVRVEEGQP